MKNALLFLLLSAGLSSFAQSVTQSVNSGALQNSGMIFSVGEIFVLPVGNANEANSGTIGVLSRIEFLVLGINETLASDAITAYPNPTSKSVFIETTGNTPVSTVYVYDLNGKLALTQTDVKQSVDLSSLPAGAYMIRTNNNSAQSFKIIKQ